MPDNPQPEASPPGDPSPVPDKPSSEARNVIGANKGPSKAATADIEERQDTQRAKERQTGRPPADAPSY
jgi:hypothetical protein